MFNIELEECPICQGTGFIEEESGWCVYVSCIDCGAHTAEIAFRNEEEKMEAAKKVAHTWNIGKVISGANGD